MVEVDSSENVIKVEKICVTLNDKLGQVLREGVVKGMFDMIRGADVAKSAICGKPRIGHLVHEHGETGKIASAGTGICKKFGCNLLKDADGIPCKGIAVGGLEECRSINVATGQAM
jgi:hypothetical protein